MNVITLGTFDVLHTGHINLFKKCRELAGKDKVTVGLNSDQFVKDYKGKPPIMTYKERMEAILSLDIVDSVMINSQIYGNAKNIIEESFSKLIVIGSDWARKDYVKQLGIDWDWLDEKGIGIAYVNYTPGISTTELKNRIKNA